MQARLSVATHTSKVRWTHELLACSSWSDVYDSTTPKAIKVLNPCRRPHIWLSLTSLLSLHIQSTIATVISWGNFANTSSTHMHHQVTEGALINKQPLLHRFGGQLLTNNHCCNGCSLFSWVLFLRYKEAEGALMKTTSMITTTTKLNHLYLSNYESLQDVIVGNSSDGCSL